MPTLQEHNDAVLSRSRKHTRRSFLAATAAAAAGVEAYRWIENRPSDDDQPAPFRDVFQANEAVSKAVFHEKGLAPAYPVSRAENLRVNGVYGLKEALIPESYRLQVVGVRDASRHPLFTPDVTAWEYKYRQDVPTGDQGHDTKVAPSAEKAITAGSRERGREEAGPSDSTLAARTPGLLLTMDHVLALPRYDLVTEFKCIEGWSQVVHWAGVRMADFMEAYPPEQAGGHEPRYVYMETPDGDYYTGYDLHVCRHPQTLLVTEMMGQPLTQFHGAPLRLHMPTKYGYKQIKRIGLISYTDERPDDYWTKLGYDWYAGL